MNGLIHSAVKVIRNKFPDLEGDVLHYVESVLEGNTTHFESSEEIYDAIGEILSSVDPGKSGDYIQLLCDDIYDLLNCDDNDSSRKLLDAPVLMANNSDNNCTSAISVWMTKKESNSSVDLKKLEKVEAKIKDKQEKRQQIKDSDTSAAPVPETQGASVSQQINKRDLVVDADGAGRNSDIRVENVDIAFGNKTLLSSCNVILSFGRRYGFVGRNGLGKTTLLKALADGDLRIPSHLRVLHVEQEVDGDDTIALDSVLEADVQRSSLLAQLAAHQAHEDHQGALSLDQVYTQLAAIEADKAPAKAAVILHGLGFTPAMQRMQTRHFSGGWRMRLALARALFARPDLLLLDEPTNMLDMKAIIWLEDYLNSWPTTLMVVSHDREFLNAVATDIVHLVACRLDYYRGNFEAFAETREELLKNRQREYDAQMAERKHIQEFIDKFRFNAKRASLVQSKIKFLDKLPKLEAVERDLKVSLRFPVGEKLSPPVLQLDEVQFYYDKTKPIFNAICVNSNSESRICIVGENGAGKTTLLKILLGDLEPINGLRHAHRSLRLGYFSQHHVDQLDLGLSSLEFVATRFPGQTSEQYRGELGAFGVSGDLAMKPIQSLSGGQKSRVAFAVMCMTRPNFLILDEPTNHLDMETIAALGAAINSFCGGVILVSHDERLISMVCKEMWLCANSTVCLVEGGMAQYRKLVQKELEAA